MPANGCGRRRQEEDFRVARARHGAGQSQDRLHVAVRFCQRSALRAVPRHPVRLADRSRSRSRDDGHLLTHRFGLCFPVPLVAADRQGEHTGAAPVGTAQAVDRADAAGAGRDPDYDERAGTAHPARLVQPAGGNRRVRQRDTGYRDQCVADRRSRRARDDRHSLHRLPDGLPAVVAGGRGARPDHCRADRLARNLCADGGDPAGRGLHRPVGAQCERERRGRGDRKRTAGARAASCGGTRTRDPQSRAGAGRAAVGGCDRHRPDVHDHVDDLRPRRSAQPDRIHGQCRPVDHRGNHHPARADRRLARLEEAPRRTPADSRRGTRQRRQLHPRSPVPRAGAAAGRIRGTDGMVAGADPGGGADLSYLRRDLGYFRLSLLSRGARLHE